VEAIVISRTAAVDGLAYKFEKDVVITQLGATLGAWVLSTDPKITFTNSETPTANTVDRNFIALVQQGIYVQNLTYPVKKDSTLYLSFGAAGKAIIYYEDSATLVS
jgi:hypothetical protein